MCTSSDKEVDMEIFLLWLHFKILPELFVRLDSHASEIDKMEEREVKLQNLPVHRYDFSIIKNLGSTEYTQ